MLYDSQQLHLSSSSSSWPTLAILPDKGAWAVKPLTPIRTRDGGTSHKIVQSIRAAMQRGIQKRYSLSTRSICRFLRRRLRMELRLSWAEIIWLRLRFGNWFDSVLFLFLFICLPCANLLNAPHQRRHAAKIFLIPKGRSWEQVLKTHLNTHRDLSILYSRLVIVVYIIFAFVMSIICREIVNTFWAWLDPHHSWGS